MKLNGNVLTRSLPDLGPTTYSYDALDRLTREQGPVITQSFGYDGGGNRQSDGIGSYVYAPSSNRLTNRPQGAVTLDPAGHTTAQAGFSYTWDGAGRLKTVSLSGTLLATYHYDARHRRTRKETTAAAPQGVATVLYAYDQDDHLLAETDASGPIRSYLWRDDTPVAQIEHRPTRKVLYLETDHLGTPTAARNEAGVLVWRWATDAFGSTLPDEDPDGDGQATTVNLRYPGQYFDPESGLHYNQARYYDPTTGRYLSPDPVGLAGGLTRMRTLKGIRLIGLIPTDLHLQRQDSLVCQGFRCLFPRLRYPELLSIRLGWTQSLISSINTIKMVRTRRLIHLLMTHQSAKMMMNVAGR